MSTFPIRQDEYSVEEISYEDMMSQLETQKRNEPELSTTEQHQHSGNNSLSREEQISQRISNNANRQLPEWLLSQ